MLLLWGSAQPSQHSMLGGGWGSGRASGEGPGKKWKGLLLGRAVLGLGHDPQL